MINNLGDVSLLVSAISGESRKGFVPLSGVPGSVGALYQRLGRRKAHCRQAVQRARDCELATQLFQRLISPVEFVLLSSGASSMEQFDGLQAFGLEIFSAAVRTLVQRSLESGGRSLEAAVYGDLLEAVNRIRSTGGSGWEALDLPLFAVYSSFEEAVQRIHDAGFSSVLDGQSPDLELLADVVIDPLRESSWGLGRRERHIRAFSRLARACREVGSVLLQGGRISLLGRFAPPMPMTQTIRYWVRPGSVPGGPAGPSS